MARILLISSDVAHGHVGGTVSAYILRRFGHDVTFLPTVQLSNHPGYSNRAMQVVPPDNIASSVAAFHDNGWLENFDAVLSGYLPSADHVSATGEIVQRLKDLRTDIQFLCDPIIGDDPGGRYIDEDAAASIKSELLPLAQIITPNRYELEWLSGQNVASTNDAIKAARSLGVAHVAATSIPDGEDESSMADLMVGGDKIYLSNWRETQRAQHGTGDVFASLLLAHLTAGQEIGGGFGRAVAGTRALVTASRGSEMLELVRDQDCWVSADNTLPIETKT